jgi:hypothetical protein
VQVEEEELLAEEAVDIEEEIIATKEEIDEVTETVKEIPESPEETVIVKQEAEVLQFLVSTDHATEELPAQDPVTESDLLAILTRNSIAGLDQGVGEEAVAGRPVPPISFISPSLVDIGDSSRGMIILVTCIEIKQSKRIRNSRSVVDQSRTVEDPRPILPNHGRMPDSARSSVAGCARESRPILPDHGRMPVKPKTQAVEQVRMPNAIAPAHEESAPSGEEMPKSLRNKRAGGSSLDLGGEFQREDGKERSASVERKEKFGLSNPGLGRDFQRKEKTDVGLKMGGRDVEQITGAGGGGKFKVQFVPKKKSTENGL